MTATPPPTGSPEHKTKLAAPPEMPWRRLIAATLIGAACLVYAETHLHGHLADPPAGWVIAPPPNGPQIVYTPPPGTGPGN